MSTKLVPRDLDAKEQQRRLDVIEQQRRLGEQDAFIKDCDDMCWQKMLQWAGRWDHDPYFEEPLLRKHKQIVDLILSR